MRRGFSIFLIAFFAFGPLSVLIDSEDSNLPACCRRHGDHHCVMAMRMAAMMRDTASSKVPQAAAPMTCRQYPGPATLSAVSGSALTVAPASLLELCDQTRVAPADYAAPRLTCTRNRADRGPPTQLI